MSLTPIDVYLGQTLGTILAKTIPLNCTCTDIGLQSNLNYPNLDFLNLRCKEMQGQKINCDQNYVIMHAYKVLYCDRY